MYANSRNSERALESTGEREAGILTTDDRMNADRGFEPKLINSERAVEWKNVRLCSLMFGYVRLCSLNGRKNVESAARGHRGREGRQKEECRIQNEVGGGARPPVGIAKCTTDGSRRIKIRAN